VDIEVKLDELQEEREYLIKMCPADMRESYEKWKGNLSSLPSKKKKTVKLAKKEIMSMVIEAMAEKEDKEESAARSALDKLLELCRGARKKKSVGMIGFKPAQP
jgi:hypothetical protein